MTHEAQLLDARGNRKYLNADERSRFQAAAARLAVLPDRAFCLCLFFTGCRISEALKLTWDRVDTSERTLVFHTLKQREPDRFRSVPVPECLLAALAELPGSQTTTPDNRVWAYSRTTAWRITCHCMAQAGIDGIKASPKGLRHGFAIACVSAKIPLPTVQKWLGHARQTTTAIYLDFSAEDERELAKRIWPK